MRKTPFIILFCFFSLFWIATTEVLQDVKKVLPSQARKEIEQTMNDRREKREFKSNDQYWTAKKELTLKHLEKMNTEGLTAEERLIFGDLLSLVEKKTEARAVYEELAVGNSAVARDAYKKVLGILSGFYDVAEHAHELEARLKEFRKKFGQSPDDTYGIQRHVSSLARHYADNGNHKKAIHLVMDELNSLSTDAPYYAFTLPGKYYESYLVLDRKQEIVDLTRKHIAQFEALVEERQKNKPADEEKAKKHEEYTSRYKNVLRALQKNLTRINLIGNTAPGFNFTHFYNTEPIDFVDTKGKVVLIEFWSSGCGPCIMTLPKMNELYAEYAPKDVVFIGVTSFHSDALKTISPEGGQTSSEDKDKELKSIENIIKNQNVTWPIAFSDRGYWDPEYGIMGIPTVVIIDKKGKVRMFEHPYYKDKLGAMLDSLLAED